MAGLSVLGADRFRRLSGSDASSIGHGKAKGHMRDGMLPLSRSLGMHRLGTTPAAARSSGSGSGAGSDVVTPGVQLEVEAGKSSEKGPRPVVQGLTSLSLRLSSGRLQERLTGEASGVEPAVPSDQQNPLASDRPVLEGSCEAEYQAPVALSERCARAFGEALSKRAKAGHALINRPTGGGGGAEGGNEAPPPEGALVPAGEGFRRGRLAEWMELAVQNAPPSMKQQRAVPGGMQDTYLRAVRGHLTDCSLATRKEVDAEQCRLEAEDALVLTMVEVHQGQEGSLMSVEVAALPSSAPAVAKSAAAGLTVGAPARLLLHHRHPALTGDGNGAIECSWPPSTGARVLVRGFHVVAATESSKRQGGRQSAGPMLMPLAMEIQ